MYLLDSWGSLNLANKSPHLHITNFPKSQVSALGSIVFLFVVVDFLPVPTDTYISSNKHGGTSVLCPK